MGTWALVGAAEFNAAHFARQRFDCTVAADGGWTHLQRAGVRPDLVLGDFDSLGYVPDVSDVRRFPSEKDESDMEIACRAALEQGAETVVLYGALGGRLDHTLANLGLLGQLAARGVRAFAVGDAFAVAALDARGRCGGADMLRFGAVPAEQLTGPYGPYVSVFAAGGPARGVREQGLKYALDGAELAWGPSRGLSNELVGGEALISVGQGALLVTFPLEAWRFCA